MAMFIGPRSSGGIPTENLLLYMNANLDVYKDTIQTPAGDTDKVREVYDQSGNNNTMTQASSAIQPSYQIADVNDRNAVQAEGGKQLDLTTNIVLNGGTIYLVGNKENTSGHYLGLADSGNGQVYFPLNWADGQTYFKDGTNQVVIMGTNHSQGNKVRAYSWDFGVDIKQYENASFYGSTAATSLSTITSNCLFNNPSFGTGFSDYAYVLVYSDTHDATKVQQISDALNATFSPTLY